jgi:hypothetical protein
MSVFTAQSAIAKITARVYKLTMTNVTSRTDWLQHYRRSMFTIVHMTPTTSDKIR